MERREPPQQRDEGPALDLGTLDWTIPPDSQPGSSPRAAAPTLAWTARRFRSAWINAVLSLLLTGLSLGWWFSSGRPPSSDPHMGVLALGLHVGSFVSAWLALRASVDTWQALYLRSDQTPPTANMTQVISLLATVVMCFHTAMVVSSLLG